MKYGSLVEEIVDTLAVDAMWADQQSGDGESPTGWFATLDIPDRETAVHAVDYYRRVILGIADEHILAGEPPIARELIGAWFVVANDLGQVHIERYDVWVDVERRFAELELEFLAWANMSEEDDE